MDEMDVQSVDVGHELRQGVQPRLDVAPVVIRRPVPRELMEHRERDTLRIVRNGLPLRPSCFLYALPQLDELCLRNVNMKRSNSRRTACRRLCQLSSGHCLLLKWFRPPEVASGAGLDYVHYGPPDPGLSRP